MFIKSSYFTFVVPLSKYFTQIHKNTKIMYYLKYSSGDKHCLLFNGWVEHYITLHHMVLSYLGLLNFSIQNVLWWNL